MRLFTGCHPSVSSSLSSCCGGAEFSPWRKIGRRRAEWGKEEKKKKNSSMAYTVVHEKLNRVLGIE